MLGIAHDAYRLIVEAAVGGEVVVGGAASSPVTLSFAPARLHKSKKPAKASVV
jgi:hypothetical protein